MTEFYQNLLNKQKPLDKAQALRQAILTTMKQKQYSNPIDSLGRFYPYW